MKTEWKYWLNKCAFLQQIYHVITLQMERHFVIIIQTVHLYKDQGQISPLPANSKVWSLISTEWMGRSFSVWGHFLLLAPTRPSPLPPPQAQIFRWSGAVYWSWEQYQVVINVTLFWTKWPWPHFEKEEATKISKLCRKKWRWREPSIGIRGRRGNLWRGSISKMNFC